MAAAREALTGNDLSIYDHAAESWWTGQTRWVRTLAKMVPARLTFFDRLIDWAGKDVLDLGCAGGFMAEALAKRDANVTGIDPAEQAIAAARTRAGEEGLSVRYDIGVGEHLPYSENAFDAVVCVDVLEHVEDLDKVIAESARVLKPGGLFLFDTINRNLLARLVVITMAEDVLKLLPKGTHDPARFIRPDEIRAVFERHGLAPKAFTGLGPRGIDRQGDFTFGRLPFTGILYIGSATRR
ncbi:MAG: bifunctional 2-polyprenyl-6-hydroxyphenol methylase/3-demethylubiquinol 3-O-methyltransferase UbiG [Alphaproteobacteria bacterium]|nr:bifunctional 2-polyprenyl-6-hydroxyphenol methylase/3-demethylubiquinol 3-O-methyltransferase UbiG [Alphaproteobacteria bacterium]